MVVQKPRLQIKKMKRDCLKYSRCGKSMQNKFFMKNQRESNVATAVVNRWLACKVFLLHVILLFRWSIKGKLVCRYERSQWSGYLIWTVCQNKQQPFDVYFNIHAFRCAIEMFINQLKMFYFTFALFHFFVVSLFNFQFRTYEWMEGRRREFHTHCT